MRTSVPSDHSEARLGSPPAFIDHDQVYWIISMCGSTMLKASHRLPHLPLQPEYTPPRDSAVGRLPSSLGKTYVI